MPCTSQWGKFSSSRLCIFDFRNEIYTKFQSRKHVLFYILAIFIFPPFWQSNTTRISNLVLRGFYATKMWCLRTCLLPVKNPPRSKVAVDKRNMTSDLAYSTIRSQGVTRLERFLSVCDIRPKQSLLCYPPMEKKNGKGDGPIFLFFKSCTVLFLFPAANRSLT